MNTPDSWEEEFDVLFKKGEGFPRDSFSPFDVKHFIRETITRERARVVEILEKVESQKDGIAYHCSCLKYAIEKITKGTE